MRYDFRSFRRGFTVIELLVVLAILTILAGMSLPGVISIVGKAKLRNAAQAVVVAATQARQFAMKRRGDDQMAYGVCLFSDADGRCHATVIRGGPGDGKATNRERELTDGSGQPALRRALPPGTDIWLAAQRLDQAPGRELAWFYESRTGRPMALEGSGFSPGAIAVGFMPEAVTSGRLNNAWGISGYDVEMTVLAPPAGTDPGLSVRSGRKALPISVYPNGFTYVVEP